jgi:hypothetical protein
VDPASWGAPGTGPAARHENQEPEMSNSTTVTGNLTREPEIRYTRYRNSLDV